MPSTQNQQGSNNVSDKQYAVFRDMGDGKTALAIVNPDGTTITPGAGGGGTTTSNATVGSPTTNIASQAGFKDASGNVALGNLDGSGNLKVAGSFAAASPTDGTSTGTLGALNAFAVIPLTGYYGAGVNLPAGLTGSIQVFLSFDGGSTYPQQTQFYTPLGAYSQTLINPSGAYGILVVGGTTHVKVIVSSYSSGSTTTTLKATYASTPDLSQVSVSNFPATQIVSGTVAVSNPFNGDVSDRSARLLGHTTVDNFPTTQSVSGTVTVSNPTANPETGLAKQSTQTDGTQKTQVTNFPATQPVSAASLPLPTNAATETGNLASIANTLTTGAQKTSLVVSGVNVDSTHPVPVSGTFSDASGVPYSTSNRLPVDYSPSTTTTGTLTAAATTLGPQTAATAVQVTVPDYHSSWSVYIKGTFSSGSTLYFEGSQTGLDSDWFSLNARRNTDYQTNDSTNKIASFVAGGAPPIGGSPSHWRGTIGGVKYFRVRCGLFTTGDSISLTIVTSPGVGGVFLQAPVAISGLRLPKTTNTTVSTTAVQVDTQMTDRSTVEVKALSTNTGIVYLGYSSAVTTIGTLATAGRELVAGESFSVDLNPATPLYAIASAAGQTVQVTEVS